MDSDRIQEIRARCDAATRGTWKARIYAQATRRNHVIAFRTGEIVAQSSADCNANFIANAREDIPWLLDQLAASQRRERAAVHDLHFVMAAVDNHFACHVCADGECCPDAPICKPKWRGLREAVAGEVITPEMKAKVAELFVRCDELSEEQATFIEELQRRLSIAERVCSAARMYIKHINSPLCVGWGLLIDALQKWGEEKQMKAAPEQEGGYNDCL